MYIYIPTAEETETSRSLELTGHLASLTHTASIRPIKDPASKNKVNSFQRTTLKVDFWPAHTCTLHTHTHTHKYLNVYKQ